jgi:hypothetical protein
MAIQHRGQVNKRLEIEEGGKCYGEIMRVSLDIPDELASALTGPGQDPARAALEAWGLEAYRQRRLSGYQLRMLLGLPSRWDLHALLKEHRIEMYTLEDWEKDWATIQELREKQKLDCPA